MLRKELELLGGWGNWRGNDRDKFGHVGGTDSEWGT